MRVRKAVVDDAPFACQVLRRSIVELCAADHHNDPTILRQWLANKTPAIVASWIVKPDSSLLVAVEQETILGVGGITDAGEITLNYVCPDARFRGVSRMIVVALEDRAIQSGNLQCRLISTQTAHGFYRGAGYTDDGPPTGKFGTSAGHPMSKTLVPRGS